MRLYEVGNNNGLTVFVIADNRQEALRMAKTKGVTQPRRVEILPLREKRIITVVRA